MVLSYVGADGTMIEAAAKAGAKGIVSAGTGAGRPTPAEDAAFDKCFKETGMLMCLCSRVASGRVVRSPGLTTARLRRRRQPAAVESALAARAGADQDHQPRRDSAHDRYLLAEHRRNHSADRSRSFGGSRQRSRSSDGKQGQIIQQPLLYVLSNAGSRRGEVVRVVSRAMAMRPVRMSSLIPRGLSKLISASTLSTSPVISIV